MPSNKKIYQVCKLCNGTKKITVSVPHGGSPPVLGPELEEITCPLCNGESYVEWGYLEM